MTRERTWAVLTVALLAVTTACSSGSDGASDPRSGRPSASSTAATEDSRLARQSLVVNALPPGRLELVSSVAVPRYHTDYGTLPVNLAATDDTVFFGDTHNFLSAVDRTTGRVRWRVRMQSSIPRESDTACSLVVPSKDASTVVMNHGGGDLCGDFTVYDQRTGKVLDHYESLSGSKSSILRLTSNSDLVRVHGRVYWADAVGRLERIEDDGSSSVVGDLTTLLPDRSGYLVSHLTSIPGSDVLVVRLKPPAPDRLSTRQLLTEREDGLLVGFRLGDDDRPVVEWQQQVRRLMSPATSPGHIRHKFFLLDDLPGTVVDTAQLGGRKTYRLRTIDPATGALSSPGVLTRYDGLRRGGPGVPVYTMDYGVERALVVDDRTVLTPVVGAGGNDDTSIVRYDARSGRPVWQWRLPGVGKALDASMDVLGLTPDRSIVYVHSSVDFDDRIWALDLATGATKASWVVPLAGQARFDLDFADTLVLDDGEVFQVARHADDRVGVIAALFRTVSAG